MTPKLKQALWTLGSAAALAAVMYLMMPPWLVVMGMAVLLAHEFAHYFAAQFCGFSPKTPFFLPLPFLTIGITYVPKMGSESTGLAQAIMSLAGPLVGAIVSLSFVLVGLICGANAVVYSAFALFIGEMLNLVVGADGRRFRAAKTKPGYRPPPGTFRYMIPST